MGSAVGTLVSHAASNPSDQINIKSKALHSEYSIEYQIGKGGFSQVFLCTSKKNQMTLFAMKRINIVSALSLPQGVEALSNELEVYKRVGSHENIVQLHCAYRLEHHFYFVMDYLLGGDLRQYLKANNTLSQQSICYIVASVGSGLHHMHQRGVFHRDIKPENILFDCHGKPYLTDFGISHLPSAKNESSFISHESSGTLPYLAPEVLTRTHEHSYQSDFWSLGIVAYELVYDRRPFEPHVPLNYIFFVANHYQKIWDELQALPNSLSAAGEDVETPAFLPFPHYHVTLNDDGSVPPSLVVPMFPTRFDILEKVDEALIDLMQRLLDVRIPERLGSLSHFAEFAHHPAFQQYGYTSENLRIVKSPVLVEDWSGAFSGQIKHSFSTEAQRPQIEFSPSIGMELDKLFYVRSIHQEDDLPHSKFEDITLTQQSTPANPFFDSIYSNHFSQNQ